MRGSNGGRGGGSRAAGVGPQGRARGRGSRRGRARRYLSASAVAVAQWPTGRAGWPGLPQQRDAGPRYGPGSRSGSGARSSHRSHTAGLRMLGAGRPRRAGARLARLAASPRTSLTPPASRAGRGAHCAAAATAGRASTSQRGAGTRDAPAVLRQQVAPNDGRRALRPLRGWRAAARGGSAKARGCRGPRELGGSRAASTFGGWISRRPPPLTPPLPWQGVAGRPAALL